MTNRLMMTPSTVRISRPGVNVLNPPSNTPTHLAMNSAWPKVERLHALAFIPNTSLNERVAGDGPKIVLYDELNDFPFARLIPREPRKTIIYEDFAGFFRTPGVGGTRYFPTQHSSVEYTLRDRCRLENGAVVASKMVTGGGGQDLLYVSEAKKFDFILMVFQP